MAYLQKEVKSQHMCKKMPGSINKNYLSKKVVRSNVLSSLIIVNILWIDLYKISHMHPIRPYENNSLCEIDRDLKERGVGQKF